MHTASLAFRFGLAELRWILTGLWGHVRWFHRFWFVVAMFTWLSADLLGSWKPFAVVGAVALYFALWARFHPDTYYRAISRPLARRELWLDLLETWPLLMEECGLSTVVIDRAGEKHTRVPSIASKHWHRNELVLAPSLLTGQTVEDFQAVADRLRTTVGATHLRVTGDLSPTLTFSFGDALAETVIRGLPDSGEPWDGRSVWMGIDTTDDDWWLRIAGTHTLVAGSSGSGKASLVWGVTIGLAPAIARGEAQVHGIDLKGGVELGMGKNLFTRYAVTPAQAVVVLEDAVEAMSARLERMAGNTRQHTASADEPVIVILIDEVAALTSYIEDRDLKSRAHRDVAAPLPGARRRLHRGRLPPGSSEGDDPQPRSVHPDGRASSARSRGNLDGPWRRRSGIWGPLSQDSARLSGHRLCGPGRRLGADPRARCVRR